MYITRYRRRLEHTAKHLRAGIVQHCTRAYHGLTKPMARGARGAEITRFYTSRYKSMGSKTGTACARPPCLQPGAGLIQSLFFWDAQEQHGMLEFSEILEHFEHLYDHLPVPILVVDTHRIVRKANNAFCRLSVQDPAEATGRLVDAYFEKRARFSAATIPASSAGKLP